MKSNALHSPKALRKKMPRETGSEDARGAWEGEWLPRTPAEAGGHPRTLPLSSVGRARGRQEAASALGTSAGCSPGFQPWQAHYRSRGFRLR